MGTIGTCVPHASLREAAHPPPPPFLSLLLLGLSFLDVRELIGL